MLFRKPSTRGEQPVESESEVTQSCPTLCDPIDSSPPGSPVPGILQARTLEWLDISFSKAWKWKVKVKMLSCVQLFETPWTAAYQAPPSMGFSRQEYWSGVLSPSPMLGAGVQQRHDRYNLKPLGTYDIAKNASLREMNYTWPFTIYLELTLYHFKLEMLFVLMEPPTFFLHSSL